MIINFKQLEAFVWVADLGNFRRAAERLNTTQPNISARVFNLEESVNTKLMERDAGSVRLTAKGKDLLEQARHVLRAAENFVEAAGQSNLVESSIKLGVTEMIVNTWLPDFLRAVKEQFPRLSIELTVDLSVNLKPELFSRSIDMAFQNGPFVRQTTGSEDLGSFPFVWVASPDLPISKTKKPGKDDMRAVPVLAHGRETNQFKEIQAHFAGSKGKAANIVPSSNIAPCVHMAIEGMGVSALPAAMARPYVEEGRLCQVKYRWVPEPLEFLARYDAETTPRLVAQVARVAKGIALQYPKKLTLK